MFVSFPGIDRYRYWNAYYVFGYQTNQKSSQLVGCGISTGVRQSSIVTLLENLMESPTMYAVPLLQKWFVYALRLWPDEFLPPGLSVCILNFNIPAQLGLECKEFFFCYASFFSFSINSAYLCKLLKFWIMRNPQMGFNWNGHIH